MLLPLLVGCGSSDSPTEPITEHDASADAPIVDAEPERDAGVETATDSNQPDVLETCPPRPACDAPLPDLGHAEPFRHVSSDITASVGSPQHRGYDFYRSPGQPQWILGKFAYGIFDDDIKDEDVDVFLLRDCGSVWTPLGRVRTTHDGEHETVEGVEDTGGRVYLDLASTGEPPLGLGRHRILFVVRGDLSTADLYIEVLEPEAKIVVTDVDGTLTSSEYAALGDILGADPAAEAHPGAAEVMQGYASRGYHIYYLTARAEWLTAYSRDWLALRGFPLGLVRVTLNPVGAMNNDAVTFKASQLGKLHADTGVVPSYGFGNKQTDAEAFTSSGIVPENCFYYDLEGDTMGGVLHTDYVGLIPTALSAPLACL